jgi:hypothetical protein
LQKWGSQGVGERKMVKRKELQRIYHHFSLVPVTPVLWSQNLMRERELAEYSLQPGLQTTWTNAQ